jgi:hypothetical protein
VGATIRLKFWRFPDAEVPSARDELIAGLYERWQELDDWIGETRTGGPATLEATAAA